MCTSCNGWIDVDRIICNNIIDQETKHQIINDISNQHAFKHDIIHVHVHVIYPIHVHVHVIKQSITIIITVCKAIIDNNRHQYGVCSVHVTGNKIQLQT